MRPKISAMTMRMLPTAAAGLKLGSVEANPSWYDQVAKVVDAVPGPRARHDPDDVEDLERVDEAQQDA